MTEYTMSDQPADLPPFPEGLRGLTLQDYPHSELETLLAFDEMAYFQQNDTPPDHQPPRWTKEELEELIQHGARIKAIYQSDGTMIGFFIWEIKGDELYLGGLDIHPNYRDKGLGSWVLQLTEQQANEEGIKKLSLTVDPLNGRGLSAYLKFGYRITDFKRNYFGPNMDRLYMIKDLDNPTPIEKSSQRLIACGDTAGLVNATKDKLIGVALQRPLPQEPQDNYHNKIVYI